MRPAASSGSLRCSEPFGAGVAGLLDDESVINEAKVLAVLDAVEATVGVLDGKERGDPEEIGCVDIDDD